MPVAIQVKTIFQYHLATKHRFQGYARGPGRLDWANQPDPFRRYEGAPLLNLVFPESDAKPTPPSASASVSLQFLSQLFYDSLAISAWKEAGGERWALRVNPSSGNLHPTEAYLMCGSIPGLAEQPAVYHYAPREHALELRAKMDEKLWARLAGPNLGSVLFVALSSIIWREAWKYGERGFRYCNHDIGHALAALRIAAARLGWRGQLMEAISTKELAMLMGLNHPPAIEPEHPDCLIALYPGGAVTDDAPAVQSNRKAGAIGDLTLDSEVVGHFERLQWLGQPNQLSSEVVDWPWIAQAVAACEKPHSPETFAPEAREGNPEVLPFAGAYPRKLIRLRRSAVAMDGVASVSRDIFYSMLTATLPARPPFDLWPWEPAVHLALFVHRVDELSPGLYLLVRDTSGLDELKERLDPDFTWSQPPACPEELSLFLLQEADCREAAMIVSCHQAIASEGCFSLGMLTEFNGPIRELGAWFYPRLFWECGMVGQVLYLEAERVGLRGTGIGCFFDDPMHELLGLKSMKYQSLYHFTVGGPLEDNRISLLRAY